MIALVFFVSDAGRVRDVEYSLVYHIYDLGTTFLEIWAYFLVKECRDEGPKGNRQYDQRGGFSNRRNKSNGFRQQSDDRSYQKTKNKGANDPNKHLVREQFSIQVHSYIS